MFLNNVGGRPLSAAKNPLSPKSSMDNAYSGAVKLIKLKKGNYKVNKLIGSSNSRVYEAVLMEGILETNEVMIKIFPSTAAGERSYNNEMRFYDSIEKKKKKDESYEEFIARIYEHVVRRLDYTDDAEFEGNNSIYNYYVFSSFF